MILEDKYILNQQFLKFEVLELLDFTDLPILNVEIDNAGTKYLSYLDTFINDNIEQRLIIPISDTRLNLLKSGEQTLYNIFNSSENEIVYVAHYNINNSELIKSFLIPVMDFSPLNPIRQDYVLNLEPDDILSNQEHLVSIYATQKAKVILDFYLVSQKIKTSLQPWVFDKFLLQIQNIIGDLLDKKYKALNEKIAYSNINIASFKVSIEITPDQKNYHLFEDIPEYTKLFKIIQLLNSENKQDLETVIQGFKNEKFIKSYIEIVKTVIKNDASIHATLANPKNNETYVADFNKLKAEKIKVVIDEQFPDRVVNSYIKY